MCSILLHHSSPFLHSNINSENGGGEEGGGGGGGLKFQEIG